MEWRKLHYECQGYKVWREWRPGGYRSFQLELAIQNHSDRAVEPPWSVSKWEITDGVNVREDTTDWEWVSRSDELYQKPVIQPGASATWTFLCYPLEKGEWVKAAELEWGGHTYRGEFDLGTYGDAHNYVNCP